MSGTCKAGDSVQTRFGKGVVREVRNNHRLLVDVQGRAMVFTESEVSPFDADRSTRRRSKAPTLAQGGPSAPHPSRTVVREVDLHGLTVEEALARIESVINDALLADVGELRLVHGKSGGRIKAALHQRLREFSSVRGFRLDARNAGVTIVDL
jgi:dsDNA-specific endonuclease/ATPase MutS2